MRITHNIPSLIAGVAATQFQKKVDKKNWLLLPFIRMFLYILSTIVAIVIGLIVTYFISNYYNPEIGKIDLSVFLRQYWT